jgi:tubulin epsilon
MTQNITIQIGQCGNQIGCRFWDLALREHSSVNKSGIYDEAMSTFFRNVENTSSTEQLMARISGKKDQMIKSLRARAVLIDMEEGVVNEIMKGSLCNVFDHMQYLTDVSGAGNNWAVGHEFYARKYGEAISELIRRNAEFCDSLESFFIMHSMGGGTGSGLGTYVLESLADEYKDVHRFVVAIYPSADDDVITSPYNCLLAMQKLTDYADCVMPIDNQSLINIVNRVENLCEQTSKSGSFSNQNIRNFTKSEKPSLTSAITSSANSLSALSKQQKPFDSMNNIVANMLLNLTSSSRFEGSLNVDLNEITMNLVPYPKLHYLLSSLSPLYINERSKLQVRGIEQMFTDAFTKDNQLLQCEPKLNLYLSCALMLRGQVNISDIRRNIERLKPQLNFISWNQEGWKTGLCSVPSFGQPYSLLCLANNTCIRQTFKGLSERFRLLYKRKAHLHHYSQVEGMDMGIFDEASNSIDELIFEYKNLENADTLSKRDRNNPIIERVSLLS